MESTAGCLSDLFWIIFLINYKTTIFDLFKSRKQTREKQWKIKFCSSLNPTKFKNFPKKVKRVPLFLHAHCYTYPIEQSHHHTHNHCNPSSFLNCTPNSSLISSSSQSSLHCFTSILCGAFSSYTILVNTYHSLRTTRNHLRLPQASSILRRPFVVLSSSSLWIRVWCRRWFGACRWVIWGRTFLKNISNFISGWWGFILGGFRGGFLEGGFDRWVNNLVLIDFVT